MHTSLVLGTLNICNTILNFISGHQIFVIGHQLILLVLLALGSSGSKTAEQRPQLTKKIVLKIAPKMIVHQPVWQTASSSHHSGTFPSASLPPPPASLWRCGSPVQPRTTP